MMKSALPAVIFALAAVACLGKTTYDVKDLQKMKAAAVRDMRQSLGVDISKLRMVHRSGQSLQAATNGWAYLNLYAFGDCTGLGFYTIGIATNVCLVSKPEVNETTSSFFYTCNDDMWTIQEYNNTNCEATGLADTNYLNVSAPGVCGAYPPVALGDDDDNNANNTRRALQEDDDSLNIYNATYSCSAASTVDFGSNYILEQYYDSNTCSQMGSFDGSLNQGCYPFFIGHDNDDGGLFANISYASIYTAYPGQYYFLSPNCTGELFGTNVLDPLVSSCSEYSDDDTDDDNADNDDAAPANDDDDDSNDDSVHWTGYTSALTCTVPKNTDCSSNYDNDDGLSDGAIAGVVVGSVAGAALIGGGAFFVANGGLAGSAGGMAAQAAPAAATNSV